jgi:hypothetical protein
MRYNDGEKTNQNSLPDLAVCPYTRWLGKLFNFTVMDNKWFLLASYICVLLLMYACSPVRVISSNFSSDASPENYQTFNFYDLEVDAAEPELIREDRLNMLKEAVQRELNERGLQLSEQPDMWVNIGVMVEEKVQTRETNIREAPLYIGQRRYHWESEEVVVDEYRQGTVSIDLIDADANEMIGQAVASGVIAEDDAKLRKRIDEGVEKVFSELWTSSQ